MKWFGAELEFDEGCDLPPESQGLPSDGLMPEQEKQWRWVNALGVSLKDLQVQRVDPMVVATAEVPRWDTHRFFNAADCGPLRDAGGQTWRSMPFAVAKAWLLEQIGLT